jgi:hypothetical protein
MEPQRHDLPFDVILHICRQGVKRLAKLPSDLHIKMHNAGLTSLEVLGSTRVTSMGPTDTDFLEALGLSVSLRHRAVAGTHHNPSRSERLIIIPGEAKTSAVFSGWLRTPSPNRDR